MFKAHVYSNKSANWRQIALLFKDTEQLIDFALLPENRVPQPSASRASETVSCGETYNSAYAEQLLFGLLNRNIPVSIVEIASRWDAKVRCGLDEVNCIVAGTGLCAMLFLFRSAKRRPCRTVSIAESGHSWRAGSSRFNDLDHWRVCGENW